MLVLLMLLKLKMLLLSVAAGMMGQVICVYRVSQKLLVLRCTAEDFHVSHNVLLLQRQGWRLFAEMIHMARFDQADMLTRKVVDHLLPAVVMEAGLMHRTGVECVLGASFNFRIIHVVVLRIVSLPSNTVLSCFDRKGRRFAAAFHNSRFTATKNLVVRFDATVLYRFRETCRLHPTAGDLRSGRRT